MTIEITYDILAGMQVRDRVLRQLRAITGRDVSEVRVTPVGDGNATAWCAMALGTDRREIPLPGRSREVAALLRESFPAARWSVAQDYDVAAGVLTEHVVRVPACLLDGAS